MADTPAPTPTPTRIKETRPTTGGAMAGLLNETRVRNLADGEAMPAGAVPAQDGDALHSWRIEAAATPMPGGNN